MDGRGLMKQDSLWFRLSVFSAVLAAAILAGCDGGPVPTPPPAPVVDVADFMFRSKGVNVGPAYVYDLVKDDGTIIRVTYTPDATTETHSVYKVDRARNCILVIAEEVWNRPPTLLRNSQTYWEDEDSLRKTCHFPLTIVAGAAPVRTEVPLAYWEWTDGVGKAAGTWKAWTMVSFSKDVLTVEEWYSDAAHPPTYHRVLVFGPQGIISLKDVK